MIAKQVEEWALDVGLHLHKNSFDQVYWLRKYRLRHVWSMDDELMGEFTNPTDLLTFLNAYTIGKGNA